MIVAQVHTLTRVSSKKRNARKHKTHRQGVSGNPQRRAQQLRQEQQVTEGQPTFRQLPGEPQTDPDRAAFRELAYRLAGGASLRASSASHPTNRTMSRQARRKSTTAEDRSPGQMLCTSSGTPQPTWRRHEG
jgi:hypothetical protein